MGNFEDHLYKKSQRYAPVLKYRSIRILAAKAVGYKLILQQGDCKNAFYNATLPYNEVTVIRHPIGDPAFQEYEYIQEEHLCLSVYLQSFYLKFIILTLKYEGYIYLQ